ncbi:MAG: hypothetical protein ACRC6V_03335 [Bacteroidales bacterium]
MLSSELQNVVNNCPSVICVIDGGVDVLPRDSEVWPDGTHNTFIYTDLTRKSLTEMLNGYSTDMILWLTGLGVLTKRISQDSSFIAYPKAVTKDLLIIECASDLGGTFIQEWDATICDAAYMDTEYRLTYGYRFINGEPSYHQVRYGHMYGRINNIPIDGSIGISLGKLRGTYVEGRDVSFSLPSLIETGYELLPIGETIKSGDRELRTDGWCDTESIGQKVSLNRAAIAMCRKIIE